MESHDGPLDDETQTLPELDSTILDS